MSKLLIHSFNDNNMGHANRCPKALIKHTKKGNYYHKRKLFLTFYKLITQFQCINYYIISILVCLTSALEAPVSISPIILQLSPFMFQNIQNASYLKKLNYIF